jgi:membrane-bound serine protease (ClpP class)
MKKIIIMITLFLLLISTGYSETGKKNATIIPVSGMIDPGLKTFIERATDEAVAASTDIIIYEMDTFGGEVEAALEISDIITAIPDSILTIAYVKTKAISAGALIALSCNKLVMKQNTTIGDCAPIMQGQEGPKMLGEKFQSPLRAKFRSLAKKNNYPSRLAEAMVSDNLEIIRIETPDGEKDISGTEFNDLNEKEKLAIVKKRTIVEKGKLLTMDAHEARELGFTGLIVDTFDDLLKSYNIQKPLKTMEITRSEASVRFIRKVAPVLMLIGLAGIGLEIKSPGLIWPAAIGIFCLGLVFGSQYLVGMANYIELILFAAGVILLFIEINFIPGFGVFGVTGLVLVFISLILSFQNFVLPKPEFPWQMETLENNLLRVAFSVIGSLVLFLIMGKWLVTSSGLRRLVLNDSEMKTEGYVAAQTGIDSLLGKQGIAESTLRPAGTAIIEKIRYDVITNGEFIEKGTALKVTSTQGNRIVVEKL